ncbi:hypothetical protein V8F33_010660 [Rhypophila sp. PSN 637]
MTMLHHVVRFREANGPRAPCWRSISSARRTMHTNSVGSYISKQEMDKILSTAEKLDPDGARSMAERAIQNLDSATTQAIGEVAKDKYAAEKFDQVKKECFLLLRLLLLVRKNEGFRTRVIARIVWDALNWTHQYKVFMDTITQRKFRKTNTWNKSLRPGQLRFTRILALGECLRKTRENLQLAIAATPVSMTRAKEGGGYTVSLSTIKAINEQFHQVFKDANELPEPEETANTEVANTEAADTEAADTEAANTGTDKPKEPEDLILLTFLTQWLKVNATEDNIRLPKDKVESLYVQLLESA